MCSTDYAHQINYEGFHRFIDPESHEGYGSFEVCFLSREDAPRIETELYGYVENNAGWYWAAGFPGCLWDGEPNGPFDTDREAYENAQDIGP